MKPAIEARWVAYLSSLDPERREDAIRTVCSLPEELQDVAKVWVPGMVIHHEGRVAYVVGYTLPCWPAWKPGVMVSRFRPWDEDKILVSTDCHVLFPGEDKIGFDVRAN